MDLIAASDRTTPKFNMTGLKPGKIVHVYDGDTFHIVMSLHNVPYRWNCRLTGVDTPELRSKDPREVQLAKQARDWAREKLTDSLVEVDCYGFDKYGRVLVALSIENETVASMLISAGLGRLYDGGKRQPWFT